MKIKTLKTELLYKEEFQIAKQILINNIKALKPYRRGINISQHPDKLGYVCISNKIYCYILNQSPFSTSKTYYLNDYNDNNTISFKNLLKYQKFDKNFKPISNLMFISKSISNSIKNFTKFLYYGLFRKY
jgi:hypothetical protein